MQEESQPERWGSCIPVNPRGTSDSQQPGEGGSYQLLSQGCCTWSIATLLLLRWSQTRQRTSLLPDAAVPGPDPVSGTQSTKNISGSACHIAFCEGENGIWKQDVQGSNSLPGTRKGHWANLSWPILEHSSQFKLSQGSALKCGRQQAWAPGLGVRLWGSEVAQNFLTSNSSSRISKKLGYPSGSVVERNASGGLVFYLHFT